MTGLVLALVGAIVLGIAAFSWPLVQARSYDLDGDGTPDSLRLGRWDLHAVVIRDAPPAGSRSETGARDVIQSRGYNMPADYVHELAGKAFSWDRSWRVLSTDPVSRVTVAVRRADEARAHIRVDEWRGRAWVKVTSLETPAAASAELGREAFECLESVLFYGMPKARTVQGFDPP
jgi:hypothetical protein